MDEKKITDATIRKMSYLDSIESKQASLPSRNGPAGNSGMTSSYLDDIASNQASAPSGGHSAMGYLDSFSANKVVESANERSNNGYPNDMTSSGATTTYLDSQEASNSAAIAQDFVKQGWENVSQAWSGLENQNAASTPTAPSGGTTSSSYLDSMSSSAPSGGTSSYAPTQSAATTSSYLDSMPSSAPSGGTSSYASNAAASTQSAATSSSYQRPSTSSGNVIETLLSAQARREILFKHESPFENRHLIGWPYIIQSER